MPSIVLPHEPRWLAAACKPLRGHQVRVTLTDASTLSGCLESVNLKSEEITLISLGSADATHTIHASRIEKIEVMVSLLYRYDGFVGEPGPRRVTGVIVHSDKQTLTIDRGHTTTVIQRDTIISADFRYWL